MQFINKEKVKNLLEKKNALLVDMRTPVQFRDNPIPGAINLPLRNLSNYLILLTAKDKERKTPIILFGTTTNDRDLELGVIYSEDLGFTTYITSDTMLKE